MNALLDLASKRQDTGIAPETLSTGSQTNMVGGDCQCKCSNCQCNCQCNC